MVDVLKRSPSKGGEKEVMERGKDKLVPGVKQAGKCTPLLRATITDGLANFTGVKPYQ